MYTPAGPARSWQSVGLRPAKWHSSGARQCATLSAGCGLRRGSCMDHKIDVLDHGFVRLVDHMGSDLSIVRAARVSYNAEWRGGFDRDEQKDVKLIHYLMEHKHTSPFEAVTFTFEVKAPIFVFRQWHRHRTWSYNEVSARYTELEEDFYIPDAVVVGYQSKSNKQARDLSTDLDKEILDSRLRERLLLRKHCEKAFGLYHGLLESGWPRGHARLCLPVNTYSRMFATVYLHNLFQFLCLRLHPHAQYEIRVYAEAILELINHVVPVAVRAFEITK